MLSHAGNVLKQLPMGFNAALNSWPLPVLPIRRSGMLFVEASAKTAANVAEVFECVAARLAGGLPISSSAAAVT